MRATFDQPKSSDVSRNSISSSGSRPSPSAAASQENSTSLNLAKESISAPRDYSAQPDEKLAQDAMRGSHRAQKILMERYESYIERLVARFLTDKSFVSDCVNHTFMQLFRDDSKYDHSRRLVSWLGTVAVHIARDYNDKTMRNERIAKKLTFIGTEGEPICATELAAAKKEEAEPSHLVATAEFHEEVQCFLAACKPEHAEILGLKDLRGWSYETIASALEIPLGTVKSRLAAARQALWEALFDANHVNAQYF